ncbi:thioesterase family protein [Spiractinospora alimapuensis]|uniref:thioesterase family protein n=1 Tax=Spiractinospora alimapuensis TaxID=2820884 RepID=UPI001F2C42DE|nr:thioesterase family protein [Spiractinospora alimapuensis]QVQ50852.1 thioesterase family protein [Spiractinospora alimapuensis]
MTDGFFTDLGEGWFSASDHTSGPWTPGHQHLGPPSALMTRALERVDGVAGTTLARITVEILGPVPVGDLYVSTQVERPGRSVELLSATLSTSDRAVAVARAWRMTTSDSAAEAAGESPPLAPAHTGTEFDRPPGWLPGYIDAMEWRSLRGSLGEEGPATVWARQRVPLVTGEDPTPLQRLMAAADSGSGVSNRLDPRNWLFINTEVTVHLHRQPSGAWTGLDANTVIGTDGVGTALTALHDEHGHVGSCAQALLVRRR